MISNYNEVTKQWEKITLDQFLAGARKAKEGVFLEVTKSTWGKLKPVLVKHGFAHPDSFIDWKRVSQGTLYFKPS